MEDLEVKAQREQEQRWKDHIFRAEMRVEILESSLSWLAERLERPGGSTAKEWKERAIEHGRKEVHGG